MTNTSVLTVNAGSSSVKLSLFAVDQDNQTPKRQLDIEIHDIGEHASIIIRESGQDEDVRHGPIADQAASVTAALDLLTEKNLLTGISSIGHRVVHGGLTYNQPQVITPDVVHELKSLVDLDPEHLPVTLELIAALRERLPDIPQVACFDTAFFHDMPRVAQLTTLPRDYEKLGLRRYGFHGLSYTYLLKAFGDVAGSTAAEGRIIFAHLGSGASLAAVKHGQAVDTTMGFSPASGIMMSSRSGDLDPAIAGFLHRQTGMSLNEYDRMVNFESGLLGVSGVSADMRLLLEQETTDPAVAEAIELFCYDVRKAIGALTTTLGGLDSLVFSGGIGEKSSVLRRRICEGLQLLGIELDDSLNEQHATCISSSTSKIGVHVIPTDEASVICQQTVATLGTLTDRSE